MAGTATLRKSTSLAQAAEHQAIIEHNAVVTDLEKLRAGAASLIGSGTYDPPSLLDGAGNTTTITVTGAALGDLVTGVSFSLDLQGVLMTAYVSAANTVAVRFQNETSGTIDLASGTIRVRVSPSGTFTGAASDMTAAQIKDLAGTVITT